MYIVLEDHCSNQLQALTTGCAQLVGTYSVEQRDKPGYH